MLVVSNLVLHNYSIIIDWCTVYAACLQTWHVWGFGGAIVKANEQVPFTSEIVASICAADSWHFCEKSHSTLYRARSSVFSGYSGFLPHVDRLGSDMLQTGPVHRQLCNVCLYSVIKHESPCGCQERPLKAFDSFSLISIIRNSAYCSSQLRVRMISTPIILCCMKFTLIIL